jgi:ketol-acid reductoisomerase
MRYSVSDTAEYGDYVAGPRLVTDATRATMRELLEEVRNGSFAKNWIDENRNGRPEFAKLRQKDTQHPIEKVGRELRRKMPFVEPRERVPGQGGA